MTGAVIAGLLLAIGVSAIAASAIAFTRQEDARSVMRLGASLAAIQFLNPMGSLIVAALLPGLFGLSRKGMRAAQSAGLYALVLFMPVIAAITLMYFARFQHLNIPQSLFGFSNPPIAIEPLPMRFVSDIAPLAIVAPALLRGILIERRWTPPNAIIALIAAALCAAALLGALLGVIRPASLLIMAAAPLPLIAISQWPKSDTRLRDAAIVITLTSALAWGLM